MKKIVTLLFIASTLTVHAEFGVSAGAGFNYKADFNSSAAPQGRVTTPDDPNDRVYDDGEVHTDGNGLTSQYGYDQNQGAQVVNNPAGGGTLTLNSAQDILDAQKSSGEQNDAQSAIEIYWQEDLTDNERWNFGLRAALRWQKIEIDSRSTYSSTIETISDTYAYSAGALLTDSKPPVAQPGYPVLNDVPSRNTTYASGPAYTARRELDADLFDLNFGPTLSFDFTDKLRLTGFIGGTVAWIDSEFSYEDGDFAKGKDSESDWLFGATVSADLSYLIGEHWGIFGGAGYTRLEDFEQKTDGRSAELQFNDSYTVRTGIFFR
jgi:hypothetical protein